MAWVELPRVLVYPAEAYDENGQLAGKGTYNSELGDWRFGELVGEIS